MLNFDLQPVHRQKLIIKMTHHVGGLAYELIESSPLSKSGIQFQKVMNTLLLQCSIYIFKAKYVRVQRSGLKMNLATLHSLMKEKAKI